MTHGVLGLLLILSVSSPAFSEPEAKAKRPRLDLRASPRMAFSPVNVLFTAELVGGDEVEEYYCPEIEWDWDDGGKSTAESDCAPFELGMKIERRFTAEHEFRRSGTYNVKATFRRAGRTLVVQTLRLTVKPGFREVES
ncbi:MAG TPA: hypothetical protein VJU18_18380 [Vicinamibacteria bacterium]|nr:hypothetical protein [Vicinamibacteria bacterium]